MTKQKLVDVCSGTGTLKEILHDLQYYSVRQPTILNLKARAVKSSYSAEGRRLVPQYRFTIYINEDAFNHAEGRR